MFVEPQATGSKPLSLLGRPRGCYSRKYVGVTSQNPEAELLGGCILAELHHAVAPEVPTGQDRSGDQLLEKVCQPEPRRRSRTGCIATAARTRISAPSLET